MHLHGVMLNSLKQGQLYVYLYSALADVTFHQTLGKAEVQPRCWPA
jgi:hypothetical protein